MMWNEERMNKLYDYIKGIVMMIIFEYIVVEVG